MSFEILVRIVFSLLVVLALMWGLAKIARRPLANRARAGALTVLSRQQLTRGSSVAIVRVADRALILGVTDAQVTLLAETDLEALEQQLNPIAERRDTVALDEVGLAKVVVPGRLDGSLISPRTWRKVAEFIRERTVRS